MQVLKQTHPIARKEHICMFCGCKIKVGEKYNKQTVVDGDLYTFVCHEECAELTQGLDMYDDGYGITAEYFEAAIDDYLLENFPGKNYKSEIDGNIKKLPRIEQVRLILNKLDERKDK